MGTALTAALEIISELAVLKNPLSGGTILIEWLPLTDIPRGKEDAVDLARMLSAEKPGAMRLPDCYRYIYNPAKRKYGVVLLLPKHVQSSRYSPTRLAFGTPWTKPMSPRELIRGHHPKYRTILELGTRFEIAKRLIDAVHTMHSCDWVHKNIRSSIILFFPKDSGSSKIDLQPALDFDSRLFVGYERARVDVTPQPDPQFTASPLNLGVEERHMSVSMTTRPNNIRLDSYQHPAKLEKPLSPYQRAYDLYSLGCVLLEIGLWKTIDQLLTRSSVCYYSTARDKLQGFAEDLSG
ncbi:hypothetical protein F4677DRAFT_463568 [Hypoxylon crocopeplum]|nr:hypothetical protein F4677DRAFT_463568 [Hypoxylon crocopeplum]